MARPREYLRVRIEPLTDDYAHHVALLNISVDQDEYERISRVVEWIEWLFGLADLDEILESEEVKNRINEYEMFHAKISKLR